jgi:uridine kinase
VKNIFNVLEEEILSIQKKPALIIGVDGIDGAGKSCFAGQLKAHLEGLRGDIVLISMDNFHHPQSIRYAQGKNSPLGFYYDSYNYESFIANVIKPFRGRKKHYLTKGFDLELDKPLTEPLYEVPDNSILIVEGIFLNRPELSAFWHYSIYLDVTIETSLARNIERSRAGNDSAKIKEIEARFFTRYRPGQEVYFQQANPLSKASVIIDNNDYFNPKIIGRNAIF